MRKLIFSLFIVLFSVTTFAQEEPTKKAEKLWDKFFSSIQKGEYQEALDYLKACLEESPDFKKARKEMANYNFSNGEYDDALKHYKYIIDHNLRVGSSDYYLAGRSAFFGKNYDDAIHYLNEMLGFNNVLHGYKEEGLDWIKRANFIKEAMANPYPFNPINVGGKINSSLDEYLPSITADNQTFIFTRKLEYNNEPNEDFYVSNWDGNNWTTAYNIGGPVNTKVNEGAQSISADGKYIFFTRCNIPTNDSRLGAVGGCDIYVTSKKGNKWAKPYNLGPGVNSPFWETQPSMAADGKTLYFVSNRKGGLGGSDIWKTELKNNRWQKPVNLGPNVNTKEHENAPFIHPDGNTLYFSSEGHVGMGGPDFFLSRKDHEGKWSEAQNLGYPINTDGRERGLYVNVDGNIGYFDSDRDGGMGGMDIYKFDLPEHAQPAKVTYVKGIVTDAKTKAKLESDIELLDLATAESHTITFSDGITGEYLVCLPTGKDYALNVSKDGYLFHSENFSLKNVDKSKPFIIDVALKAIEVGNTVVLKNIFFELGSADLKKESFVELDKLVLYLTQNKTVKIELGGHSDSTGEDAFNLNLSKERAKSVYDWLLTKEIASDRLSYKGYGETMPIADNNTEEGRAKNRRTEFKIIGN